MESFKIFFMFLNIVRDMPKWAFSINLAQSLDDSHAHDSHHDLALEILLVYSSDYFLLIF